MENPGVVLIVPDTFKLKARNTNLMRWVASAHTVANNLNRASSLELDRGSFPPPSLKCQLVLVVFLKHMWPRPVNVESSPSRPGHMPRHRCHSNVQCHPTQKPGIAARDNPNRYLVIAPVFNVWRGGGYQAHLVAGIDKGPKSLRYVLRLYLHGSAQGCSAFS